ncbi:MAG: hypothetical protein KGL39_38025 [Patescibacteria group bacterium]|nr:hypothetical protein [Patescibacteria group bacterium]
MKKYDGSVHDLNYVITDVDARLDRLERALREYFTNTNENRAASVSALAILNEGDR